MKEATGELSMTVVTIIAVIVIAAIVAALRTPIIKYINGRWNAMTGEDAIEKDTGKKYNNDDVISGVE